MCSVPDIVTYFVSGRITGRILRGRGTTQSGDTPYNIMVQPSRTCSAHTAQQINGFRFCQVPIVVACKLGSTMSVQGLGHETDVYKINNLPLFFPFAPVWVENGSRQ